ncbi:MAG: phosphate ABC transporter permease subunit PstC [Caulobacteraceae bacterium]
MTAVGDHLPEEATRRANTISQARGGSSGLGDRIFAGVSRTMAILVFAVLCGAALSMLWGGMLAFKTFGLRFIWSSDWDPVNLQFGALIPIYGTLVTSAIAIVFAVPLSFGIAIFLTELAPKWLRGPVSAAIELLAAVPSIIYGMWGLFVFVPFVSTYLEPWVNDHIGVLPIIGPLFSGPPIGIGMLTAGTILAIMILPFITAVMRDVFGAVPAELKEAAYSFGSTTWEVVSHVSVPYTRTAVVGAIFLGLGRALGETMAVTFVLGNAHQFAVSLFMPGNTIAAAIANEFTEADSAIYSSSLIALAFLLFLVTFVVIALAKLMLMRIGRLEGVQA